MTFKEEYKAFDRAVRADIYCQFDWSDFETAQMMCNTPIKVFEAWWRMSDMKHQSFDALAWKAARKSNKDQRSVVQVAPFPFEDDIPF